MKIQLSLEDQDQDRLMRERETTSNSTILHKNNKNYKMSKLLETIDILMKHSINNNIHNHTYINSKISNLIYINSISILVEVPASNNFMKWEESQNIIVKNYKEATGMQGKHSESMGIRFLT